MSAISWTEVKVRESSQLPPGLRMPPMLESQLVYAALDWEYLYEGRPERKDRLRIAFAQVNELHHFKVNGPQ
jgi:hypothetical protein